jgi:biopolymer transport protein ExbB/TolQ
MNDVTTVMNDWWTYPMIWVIIVMAVFLILLLAKLYSMSSSTRRSFKELSNKIDSLYRTSDAFNELNTKIDNLSRNTNDIQRTSIDHV